VTTKYALPILYHLYDKHLLPFGYLLLEDETWESIHEDAHEHGGETGTAPPKRDSTGA
jgi:hypothetical protein